MVQREKIYVLAVDTLAGEAPQKWSSIFDLMLGRFLTLRLPGLMLDIHTFPAPRPHKLRLGGTRKGTLAVKRAH